MQIAKEKLNEIKEIDICIGNVEKKQIVEIVENYINNKSDELNEKSINKIKDVNLEKDFLEFGDIVFSEKTRATIKVQDGCNQFCTYCLIPYARGRVRSRKKENVLDEVTKVANLGIKEIVLTGIHIASYGIDLDGNYYLIDLLEDLNNIDGIERIRLGSLEPTIVTQEFVERMSKLKKICNQFHLSLQSGCNKTLKRMNRKYTAEQFEEATLLLRKYFENVNLTTDIIVGFPGETDEEFEATFEFLKKIKFYKMHVFKYSPREGTLACKMPNQVDGKTKEERSHCLIELSNKNQNEYNSMYIGKPIDVLFEEETDGIWSGYTRNYIKVKVDVNDGRSDISEFWGEEGNINLENKIINVMPIKAENQELIAKL